MRVSVAGQGRCKGWGRGRGDILKRLTLAAFALCCACSSPPEPAAPPAQRIAAAAPPVASPEAQQTAAKGPAEKKICKREKTTGSNYPTRICRTQSEWDAMLQAGREGVDELNRQTRSMSNTGQTGQ